MSSASGTSLNRSTAQQTGEYAPNGQGCIRKTIAYSASTASAVNQTIGVIPSNAIIIQGTAWVTTAFNGTTPTLNVGYAADSLGALNATAYASSLALPATTTPVAFDELAATTTAPRAVATTVTANLTYTTTTAGSCEVILTYVNG